MKALNLLLTIGLLTILTSCNRNRINIKDRIYYDEFYSVINDLIRSNLSDVSAIRYVTEPVVKPPWHPSSRPTDSILPPEPTAIGTIRYNWLSFYPLAKQRGLDSVDVDFMYHSIDSSKIIVIDSNRVCIPVITKATFNALFQDSGINIGYDRIKKKYGTSCYISVSTPVFNSDYSKIVLAINYYCGPLWGNGFEFILRKKDGKWILIEKYRTWIS
jgi:hypothetical protein